MTETKTPITFWILIGLALVWNLLGVSAFVAQMMTTPEMIAALPSAERELIEATPTWVNIAFGVAVIAGALGCLLLLLKKPISFYVLCLSLVGVLAQMSYVFLVSHTFDVYGPGQMVMPIMVIVVAVALVLYSRQKFS